MKNIGYTIVFGLMLFLMLGGSRVFAAPPYLLLPCAPGTPAPTECGCKFGTDPTVLMTPHTDATGKKYCYCELGGKTGSVAWTVTPANLWGPGPNATGTVDMTQFAPPAALGAATVVPALPQ